MIDFDRLLVTLGLRSSFADRYAKTVRSLDGQLVGAIHAMRLKFVDDERTRYLGWYCAATDRIAVNVYALTETKQCVNNVLAHELIHSTGHHSRLNRGHVGEISRHGGTEYVPESEEDSEEVIAQYGGMLLLTKLGIKSEGIEEDTVRYLRKYGRPNGPNDTERLEAVRAVKYILNLMNQTKELSHVETN